MCVAVPGRLVHRGRPSPQTVPGRVAYGSLERDVELVMVPDAAPGDYVLVHSGYAISVISERDALETLALLNGPSQAGTEGPSRLSP
jgi:hydrogenase expression/formation protein HypC